MNEIIETWRSRDYGYNAAHCYLLMIVVHYAPPPISCSLELIGTSMKCRSSRSL